MSWARIDLTGDVPPARHSASVCCTSDDTLVLYGGAGGKEAYSSVHLSSIAGGAAVGPWRRVDCTGPACATPRWGHGAHVHGGAVVAFGGSDVDRGPLQDVRLLDLSRAEWRRPHVAVSGAVPPPRAYAASALAGDALYVLAGGALHAFDLRACRWDRKDGGGGGVDAEKATLTATRDGARLVAVGGVARGSRQILGDVRVFDVRADRWAGDRCGCGGAAPGARAGHVAAAAADKLVLFGGVAGRGDYPAETHELNLDTMAWFRRRGSGAAVPQPRSLHCACSLGDGRSVFVFGGISAEDEKTPLGDAFVYTVA